MLASQGLMGQERPQLPIVMYHRIHNRPLPNDGGRVLPTLEFEEQLMFLRDEGYTTLFASDYQRIREGKLECPQRPIILTFDDGYDDNLLEAYPLLRRYGMKAQLLRHHRVYWRKWSYDRESASTYRSQVRRDRLSHRKSSKLVQLQST